MNETFNFLKVRTQINYIATIDSDKPSNRPFGDPVLFDGKIYIITNKEKKVSKQIAANNHVCIVACDNSDWIRINCQLIDDSENIEAKKAMMAEFDWMEEAGYTLDNPNFQVLYIANADARIYDIEGNEIEAYNF